MAQITDSSSIVKKLGNVLFHEYGKLHVGVLPICGIDPDSGTELGLSGLGMYKKDSLHTPVFITPTFYYSTNKWMNANFEIQKVDSANLFQVKGEFSKNPTKIFKKKEFVSEIPITKILEQINYGWSLSETFKINTGQHIACYLPEENTEIIDTSLNIGALVGISYDARNNPVRTSEGYFINLGFEQNINLFNKKTFYRIYTDVRWFYSFSSKLSLGVQTRWQYVSFGTPYLMQSRLSGPFAMRGFESRNRYMDSYSQYIQTEIRRIIGINIWVPITPISPTDIYMTLPVTTYLRSTGGWGIMTDAEVICKPACAIIRRIITPDMPDSFICPCHINMSGFVGSDFRGRRICGTGRRPCQKTPRLRVLGVSSK